MHSVFITDLQNCTKCLFNLFVPPAAIAANVRAVFTCLLNQVSMYITEGLERARDSLTEAAALRERFVVPSVSRRVAAAAASAVITLAFVQKQQLLLVKAVSDLSWFLCNVVGAVWLLCSNILQTLYFGFYYLWMVRMLHLVKKWL
ncbi:uncharacterized protein LOC107863589 isoform X3 [Capsicum annuum]|uniref:uncharacterized protein LOC107863589 isoform X3 n=1 Tax=Capsicum annuum TaxID=4072 RepID=UPI001FB14C2F|nr:uncharacterized protein LOC107863589 isoform X3 [Capsicum annuum]